MPLANPDPVENVPQIRIFDYLHVSARRLMSDSNFFVHRNVFKYINKYYPGRFFFYTTYDASVENDKTMQNLAKQHGNIQPVPIRVYSTNGFFRNALDWENLSKYAPDIDIIWNNTPEIQFELLSFYISKGNYVPSITYSHWFPGLIDPPIFANYQKHQDEAMCIRAKYFYNYFLAHRDYNNSRWGTALIRDGFKNLPDPGWNAKITDRIRPLYLSVDHEEIDQFKPEKMEKFDVPVIVFNHRHNVYTGFTFFMKAVKKIIDIRPQLKFKILLTSVGENDRSEKHEIPEEYFLNKETLPYPKYCEYLWKSHIQIGAHTGDNQWSMSFLDGMFANLVPLYRRGHFFDEMFEGMDMGRAYSFASDEEFIERLIFMLENYKYFEEKNHNIYNHFRENWTWDTLIHDWVRAFVDCYDQQHVVSSDKLLKLDLDDFPMDWNKVKGIIAVSDQRNTCTYRKAIKETMPVREDMTNPKIVFYRNDQPIKKTVGYF